MTKWLFCRALVLVVWVLPAAGLDLKSLAGVDWFGLYMNGQKVGYARTELAVGPDGTVTLSEDAAFKLTMSGVKQDMHIVTKRRYGPGGDLVSVESEVTDVSGLSRFRGVVEGGELSLRTWVGGHDSQERLPRPRETLRDATRQLSLVLEGAEVGKTAEFVLFEPMFKREIPGRSEIVGVEERVLDGVATRVYRVRTVLESMGIESVTYVAEDGTTLEDRTAGGIITMRLEPEGAAKDVSYSNDVIVSNAAVIEGPIDKPRTRVGLRLELSGPLRDEYLISDHRQTMRRAGEAVEFQGRVVGVEDAPDFPLELPGPVREWIGPSTFVQSDHPRIVETAKAIVGDERDAFAASTKLVRWVYENVRSTFSARLTNSLEVLDHMEGDCTEHSMLFIGLARAAGLPAREAAGLIYVDHPRPGFYFHQWATVWVGEWIDVDPTFNQPIADATHIKLAEGDLFEQTKLLPIIGHLRIRVLDDTPAS